MSMSINYRELRERLRIEDVLGWMSWKASGIRGHQLRSRCPFCRESGDSSVDTGTASGRHNFSVNTRRNLYRCFKCNQSGNALDLWSGYRSTQQPKNSGPVFVKTINRPKAPDRPQNKQPQISHHR